MTKPLRVCLVGHDGVGWAHDEDLRLTSLALALGDVCELAPLSQCDVVHASWWMKLAALPEGALTGRRVVCYTSDDPWVEIFGLPGHRRWRQSIGMWITRNSRERRMFDRLGLRHATVPLMIDVSLSHPLPPGDPCIAELRERWRFPADRYLIGSFQRDTELIDLVTPKLKKGPDLFAEIVWTLWKRRLPIHAVLAGPRRFWLRRRLNELGVPFTFVGKDVQGDDIAINTQSRTALNVLYNFVDVCVVTSRFEGAPDQVLAAAAAGSKIISTPVGTVPDIVDASGLYRSVPEAVEIIAADMRDNVLAKAVPAQLARIVEHHRPETVAPLLRALYEDIERIPVVPSRRRFVPGFCAPVMAVERLVSRVVRRRPRVVAFWRGGREVDAFLELLVGALRQSGVTVVDGAVDGVDVHMIDGAAAGIESSLAQAPRRPLRVVQRLGRLWNGRDGAADEAAAAARLNRLYASASVFDSAWLLERALDLGYRPASPMIIHPAADPRIFTRDGRALFAPDRRVRLLGIAAPDDGAAEARWTWLVDHLDRRRFACTIIGVGVTVGTPDERARLMRDHDVFVEMRGDGTGTESLPEALASGLPALFVDDGGNAEVVGHAGLGFQDVSEMPGCLNRVVQHYESLQRLLTPPTLAAAVAKYVSLIDAVATGQWAGHDALDVPGTADAERPNMGAGAPPR